MYWDIDYRMVYEIIQKNISDIEDFVSIVERDLA